MARWEDERWQGGRDDSRSWRDRLEDRWREERQGREWRGEDRDRWRASPEEYRPGEGRYGGEYGRDWERERGMRGGEWGESGREGWRSESRRGRELGAGRSEYPNYGFGGPRDWSRDEGGYGRGEGLYGREHGGSYEGYGRESGAGRYRGYEGGGHRGYQGGYEGGAFGGYEGGHGGYEGYGSGERDRYGHGGREYGYGAGGGEYGRHEYRGEDDRGPLERLGDRFRQGVRRLTGKGPKGFHRSDDRIRDDVCERIARSGLDAEEVEVRVEHGEVTLSGTVRSREEKRMMEDVAEDVFGVDEVHNTIRVRREDQRWTAGQASTSQGTQPQQQGTTQAGQRSQQGTSTTSSPQPGTHR